MNCCICSDPATRTSKGEPLCQKKKCRLKLKSKRSHKQERSKPWVKCRSRLQDRHRAICKRAGVPVGKVGDHLKASTRRIKIHIQNQFHGRWVWSDYGFDRKDEDGKIISKGFCIDHIVPCLLFDVSKKSHLDALWSLENLRPMDHLSNLAKHDDVDISIIPESLLKKVEELGIKLR
jgi:hypothetical protein